MNTIQPSTIKLHRLSKQLELVFGTQTYRLSAEFLRVHSPSAEVRGHGKDEAVLQYGKINVGINRIAAAGNYALQIFFDDGHQSGIYTWSYLHELCVNEDQLWQTYLDALHRAGKSREPDVQVIQILTDK